MPRKHANKVCFLCERPLLKVEKYGCGSAFGDTPCWWVPTIKEHGLDEAVRISTARAKARESASTPSA
ncbi:hypothetical protein VQ02_23445 [Methylobacterium variabile]|uniref:Uncharacterized protein n=1 Tax=Methylobacterium variabile TaxID=298794 RepID=A0A0J6SBE3_9HYPH|nr:hypothetical protein [Methylobacterium variabile]KMO32505.1 hypothetical protein VQ02_23445 [Methylobacterium variabile]